MRHVLLGLVYVVLAVSASVATGYAQAAPEFKLGFKTLAELIPEVVGQPVEPEQTSQEGATQRTTTGLMVWLRAQNVTSFTDGSRTWINGPFGLQSRGNDERFEWETAIPTPAVRLDRETTFLFGDDFPGGRPRLQWVPYPYFFLDNLRGAVDPTSPSHEKGIGVLTNENVGGFAALSYVARDVPGDFYLEAWVYITTTREERGALQGLTFRVDPGEARFYRLAARFTEAPELAVAYVGRETDNFPVILKSWAPEELPGGPPSGDGWHRLGVEVVGNAGQFYWDGARLPGGAIAIDRIPTGFAGSYATFVGGLGLAETRVDDFRIWQTKP